jgi:hypothetical protein
MESGVLSNSETWATMETTTDLRDFLSLTTIQEAPLKNSVLPHELANSQPWKGNQGENGFLNTKGMAIRLGFIEPLSRL